MGGELLGDNWLAVKDSSAPLPGSDQATRENLAHILDKPQQPISYSPIAMFRDPDSELDTGRGKLLSLFWGEGTILDYQLGSPGISAQLRKLPLDQRLSAIPEHLRPLILQAQLGPGFPPTVLLHGTADPLVLPEESTRTYEKLRECGVKAELHLVEGGGHALVDPKNPPNLVSGAREREEEAFEFVLGELLSKAHLAL